MRGRNLARRTQVASDDTQVRSAQEVTSKVSPSVPSKDETEMAVESLKRETAEEDRSVAESK